MHCQAHANTDATSFAHTVHHPCFDIAVSGNSTGTDQPIFTVVSDTWLNLRTGIVSGLNYTQLNVNSSVYTFNPDYAGQVAQELTGRADATVYEKVSLRVVQPACLVSSDIQHSAFMCHGMFASSFVCLTFFFSQ